MSRISRPAIRPSDVKENEPGKRTTHSRKAPGGEKGGSVDSFASSKNRRSPSELAGTTFKRPATSTGPDVRGSFQGDQLKLVQGWIDYARKKLKMEKSPPEHPSRALVGFRQKLRQYTLDDIRALQQVQIKDSPRLEKLTGLPVLVAGSALSRELDVKVILGNEQRQPEYARKLRRLGDVELQAEVARLKEFGQAKDLPQEISEQRNFVSREWLRRSLDHVVAPELDFFVSEASEYKFKPDLEKGEGWGGFDPKVVDTAFDLFATPGGRSLAGKSTAYDVREQGDEEGGGAENLAMSSKKLLRPRRSSIEVFPNKTPLGQELSVEDRQLSIRGVATAEGKLGVSFDGKKYQIEVRPGMTPAESMDQLTKAMASTHVADSALIVRSPDSPLVAQVFAKGAPKTPVVRAMVIDTEQTEDTFYGEGRPNEFALRGEVGGPGDVSGYKIPYLEMEIDGGHHLKVNLEVGDTPLVTALKLEAALPKEFGLRIQRPTPTSNDVLVKILPAEVS